MSPVVLVVEDEPDLADLYSRWLSEECAVRTALDGEQALTALDEDLDVVLLDRRMPGLTGDEVLERIRERRLDCRVAMVTAVDPDFDIVEMGFDDYLEKPVTRDDLVGTVECLASLSSYDREVRELFSLASKKATLEAEKPPHELTESDEYTRLRRQLSALDDRVQGAIDAVDDDSFRVLFRDIDGRQSAE